MFTCWRMSCPRGYRRCGDESQQILKDYLVKNDQAETDDHYIYQYLDLVDETNGRGLGHCGSAGGCLLETAQGL